VLPSLSDASGTIASRFVVFNFAVSFFGREDLDLERRLTDELPGILNWSMTGWRRLQERGHFIQPGSGREIATNLGYLASPMTQFIEETYELREGEAEVTDHVYAEWTNWWSATGQSGEPGNTTSFGLKLAAAFPHIRKRERKKMVKGDVRRWFVYEGLQRRGSEGKVDQGEMDIYRDDAGGGGAPF
jgi:putative DNA primase/helicase